MLPDCGSNTRPRAFACIGQGISALNCDALALAALAEKHPLQVGDSIAVFYGRRASTHDSIPVRRYAGALVGG